MCILKIKRIITIYFSYKTLTHINGVRASITLFNFTLTYFIQSEIIHQFCSVHHLLIEYLPLQYFAQLVRFAPGITTSNADALSRMLEPH